MPAVSRPESRPPVPVRRETLTIYRAFRPGSRPNLAPLPSRTKR
jgi:hypothetical protein